MECKKINSEEFRKMHGLDNLSPMEAGEIQGGVNKCKCKCKCYEEPNHGDVDIGIDMIP